MTNGPRLEDTGNEKRRNSVNDIEDGNAAYKRRRADSVEFQAQLPVHPQHTSRRLDYSDYTVGWICALSIEMTAAMAMLDEEHETLPRKAGDDNVYVLGSISGHNVVIACLRDGVYGIASATAVGQAMRRTYPRSVTLPLMVGIGGGVPSMDRDIRLGDVAVGVPSSKGPAVKQYDFGKTTSDGLPEVIGELNKPAAILLHAISKWKATHELRQGSHVVHISNAMKKHGLHQYANPGSGYDTLFEAHCQHLLQSDNCGASCSIQRVHREPRADSNPVIHYGTIGSGNQVIKHSGMRDRIAEKFGIVCFEMEAAGLMDNIPCLVIRGICDYCDAQKKKDFQKFAALSAAAYAKDLLSTIAIEESSVQTEDPVPNLLSNQELQSTIMEALYFEEAENRRATVRRAHLQTCKWFVDQPFFTEWHDMQNYSNHCGLLWVKGKPGTGKSTLMKFVLEKEEKAKLRDRIIISFFFNARGNSLEKSVVGMYRSLIHQLLKQVSELQVLLHSFSSSTAFDQDRAGVVETLENLFSSAVEKLQTQRLLCIIDALDECPESQIREMLRHFEDIGAATGDPNKMKLQVLLSSRHYPNISIEYGKSIILEDQDGHSGDLIKYIDSELKIGKPKQIVQIKQAILEKARGIFLWVVLTIKILRTEHDKGRLKSPMTRLDTIPLELDDLFRDILTRDNERIPELILCIQWILYARRPLQRAELYYALMSNDESEDLSSCIHNDISIIDMDKYILDCSKGLAELTRGKKPTAQFIHESVREFLMQPRALAGLLPGDSEISEAVSHRQLRDCCVRYMTKSGLQDLEISEPLAPAGSPDALELRTKMLTTYPFSKYAVESVLYHADTAQRLNLSQEEFLLNFQTTEWANRYDSLQDRPSHRLCSGTIDHVLARLGLPYLLLFSLDLTPPTESELEDFTMFLVRNRDFENYKRVWLWRRKQDQCKEPINPEHANIWFELLQDTRAFKSVTIRGLTRQINALSLLWPTRNYDKSIVQRCLEFAAKMKRPAVLRLLLSDDYYTVSRHHTGLLDLVIDIPVRFRVQQGRSSISMENDIDSEIPAYPSLTSDVQACVDLLFPERVEYDFFGSFKNILEWYGGTIVKTILEKGRNTSSSEKIGVRYLSRAVKANGTELVKLLLEAGASTNDVDASGRTALHFAAEKENPIELKKFLLEAGFNINDINAWDATGLLFVSRGEKPTELVTLLLEAGASINDVDVRGRTALHFAKSKIVAEILLHYGADIAAKDMKERTPLHYAVQAFYSHPPLVTCLLQHRADVNAKDVLGMSPLYYLAIQTDPDSLSEQVFKILLRHGADINMQTTRGDTVLHAAASQSRLDLVKLLLLEGANVNIKNFSGLSPLHMAVWDFAEKLNQDSSKGSVKPTDMSSGHIVTMLYAFGAEPSIPSNGDTINPSWPRFVQLLEALVTSGRPELESILDTEFLEKWKHRDSKTPAPAAEPSNRATSDVDDFESLSNSVVDLSQDVYIDLT